MAEKKGKEEPILSQYLLQEEIRSLKVLVIFYCIFIFCAIAGFIAGKIRGIALMENWQFGIMAGGNIFSSFYAGFTIYKKAHVFAAKYLLFAAMGGIIALGMFWADSLWIFLGYYLLLILAGLFNNWKFSFFTGALCLIFFIILINYSRQFSISEAVIWLVYFAPVMAVTMFINNRNNIFIREAVRKQQEIEDARTILEIKVYARTRELRELAGGLEGKVKERTLALEEKIKELERFLRLTVGREMRMVELKKEVQILKEQLKEKQKVAK